MVPTLFGSRRDTSLSATEVGTGMNTIATMAMAAIKAAHGNNNKAHRR